MFHARLTAGKSRDIPFPLMIFLVVIIFNVLMRVRDKAASPNRITRARDSSLMDLTHRSA
jgi:hypothetical protein